jgi:hypothetical protein
MKFFLLFILFLSPASLAPATPRYTTTNSFGRYTFSQLPIGVDYAIGAAAKKYSFPQPTRIIMLADTVHNADFVSAE